MSYRIVEGSGWGDHLTEAEVARMGVVLDGLADVTWADALLNNVKRNGGVRLTNQPLLLEARIAYELHQQGIAPTYEFSAGVGKTTVDFRLPGEPQFLVEVVSVRTSAGVQAATWQRGSFSGQSLSSNNLRDPERQMQSEEAEAVVAQSKLGEKVYADGRLVKFPPRSAGSYHVIVADLRGYLGGGIGLTMKDLRGDAFELLHGYDLGSDHYVGGHKLQVRKFIPQRDGSVKPFSGLLEANNPLDAAPHFRERIHLVHFLCESTYEPEEILGGGASYVIVNDRLFSGWDELAPVLGAYPLVHFSRESLQREGSSERQR